MVPEGWREGRLDDLLDGLESGVSVNGEDREFKAYEKAVLKVSAVSYGSFDPSAAKVIEGEELSRAKTNPKCGQIIISRSNTEALVGASAYIEHDYPNLFLPDKLWQTVPKANNDMKWLSYVLASSRVRYTLSNLATGTSGSMKNITKDELLSLKILVPPAIEQKKIAQILSTWDKAITTTEQLLANSQQQKKALMQQLLTGKKRLLDENGVRFSGEWEHGVLSDLGKIAKGKALSSKDLIEGKYPVVAGGKVSPYNHNQYTHENVITVSASGAYAGYVAYHPYKLWASDCSVVVNKPTADIGFIYQLMTYLQTRIYSLQSGGAQPHVYPKDLDCLKVRIPPLDEQQRISQVLSLSDCSIDSLKQKLEALKQEKKALMQQLLTGKRRVKVEEEAA